jgi:hypothetical protein
MPAPADPAKFEEAVGWFRRRVAVPDATFAKLSADAREYAFKVAGASELGLVQDVFEAIDRALEGGTTLEEFKASVGDKLNAAWGSEQPWRVETIFRTNVQKAYSEGRRAQMEDPDTLEDRPFWELVTLLDGRTSPICRALSAPRVVLPADHPFWKQHQPPLHHNCRTAIEPLTEDGAQRAGVLEQAPSTHPADGFGRPGFDWEPDLTVVPPALVDVYRQKREDLRDAADG